MNPLNNNRTGGFRPRGPRPGAGHYGNRPAGVAPTGGRQTTPGAAHRTHNHNPAGAGASRNDGARSPLRRKDAGRRGPSRKVSLVRQAGPNEVIPSAGESIRVIPLGGVEEIGKNMTLIEYKDEIIVIDAGLQFATTDTPGIDFILPNTKYLEDRRDKVRALVITHGHLDHIGAIPYIMDKLGNPPIYTREFGALLIKKRHSEFPHLPALNFKIVGKDDGAIPITKHLKVRFFGLTHSIPDSSGVIVETPFGDIVATGDVRVENKDGVPVEEEVEHYALFKDRKVMLLCMDSTGAEKPGWSPSEELVIKNIEKIVGTVPGRIIISTFASQVERIISFINSAAKYQKKVVVEGRSMKNNIEIIKHLKLAETKHIIQVEDMEAYPPSKLMILATGAQGEEFAALMRISNRTHKQIKLNKTDTIILSSSIIPGNEKSVTALKDNLYRHDCKIITYLDSDVHTSGHGKRQELEWIHKQIPYRFFMPVHGHHFMLKIHAEMSKNLGTPAENIVVPDNGSIIEFYDGGTKFKVLKEKAPASMMMVDGFAVGDAQEVVLRDRQMLAQDGMFVIVASINATNGKLRKSPDLISRGFVYLRESQNLLQDTRNVIKKSIEDSTHGMNPINFDYVKNSLSDNVSRFLFQKTAKRPIVIPVLIAV
ncbi:MAG: ribonuclease J [Candidatus Paceibacterota bacterium]